MQVPQVRFTIRSLIIVVALIGINLAGGIATWTGRPGEPKVLVNDRPRGWPPSYREDAEGNLCVDVGRLETGEPLVRLVRGLGPPGLPQIWSPVIACASITLLVLLVPLGRQVLQNRSATSNAVGGPPTRRYRVWRAARWATIVVALVALNFVGAVFRPRVDRGGHRPDPGPSWGRPNSFASFDEHTFRDAEGRVFFAGDGGTLVIKEIGSGIERPATLDDLHLPPHQGNGRSLILETIVYKTDGSIVAYDGDPGLFGRILGRPRVLQPPTMSFLEMWWPVIGSASITLLVLDVSWRQIRRHQAGPIEHLQRDMGNLHLP